MAADNLLVEQLPAQPYDAALRFYQWRPPAVSLGFHQTPKVIAVEDCQRLGWHIVRRPTGGRALLHNRDLSYAVVIKSKDEGLRTLRYFYNKIATVVVHTLSEFGVVVDKETSKSNEIGSGLKEKLCLKTRTRGEVMVGGRKIAAGAQRLYPGAILQHGSLTLRGDIADITKVTNIETNRRANLRAQLIRCAVALDEAAGRYISFDELSDEMEKSFLRLFGWEPFESEFSASEMAEIHLQRPRFDVFLNATI